MKKESVMKPVATTTTTANIARINQMYDLGR